MEKASSLIARDWEIALIKAGFDFPLNRQEISTYCPFHSDHHKSLSINPDKGVWICHAYPDDCGRGHIRSFLAKYLGVSIWEAEKLALTDQIDAENFELFDEDVMLSVYNSGILSNEELPEITINYDRNRIPRSILDRGFEVSYLYSWECGFDAGSNSFIIPIHDRHHRKVGWVKRQREGQFPKYLYNKGFQKSRVLFGQDHLIKFQYHNDSPLPYLCIAEGPLDAMWLAQTGIPAVSLLGLYMSTEQEYLLSHTINTSEVVVCLDNDGPGIESGNRIADRLKKYFLISRINLPDDAKDVQDVRNIHKLRSIITNREII
jgi:DNA primase